MANKKVKKDERKPAHELLVEILDKHGINFFVRKQSVRYMEDNGMVIEPPKVIVFYKDEANNAKLELPKKE